MVGVSVKSADQLVRIVRSPEGDMDVFIFLKCMPVFFSVDMFYNPHTRFINKGLFLYHVPD